jgi:uncharacterized YceG family protein
MSGDYGPGEGGPWPPTGSEPQWDDSVWQQDQPSAWGGQEGAQPAYDQRAYDGRGYGGQDFDQGQGYPGQGYAGQAYEDPRYEGRNYGLPDQGTGPGYRPPGPGTGPQQYPRTGPQPAQRGSGAEPVQRGTGEQPAQRLPGAGTGPRPAQRGSGAVPQVPPGYDPRGTGPRRAAGGNDYPPGSYAQRGDDGYGQAGYEGWESGPGDDSFLPGFGPRNDFDGSRGQYDDRRDPRRGGARRPRESRADGRAPDPRRPDGRVPAGRVPEVPGPDPRGRDHRRRPRDWDGRDGRDPRGPARRDGHGGSGNDRNDDIDREAWSRYRGEKRRRSPIRRLAPWIALLVIVVPLAIGGLHVWDIYQAKVHPADYVGDGTGPAVTVQVQTGETAENLAPTLLADGVVASTRAFILAAENSSDPTGLEPGYFILNHHMQATAAWAALLNPKNRDQFMVTIPEGKRASQVILIMSKETKIPLKDFQQVLDHPAGLGLPSYAKGKVEGYLFPATYPIQPHETALQILQAMVARFNVEAQQVDLADSLAQVGLTPTQVIIEASMAQAEGGAISDYPKIARVIINRLKAGMPLQFDSVLLYGLNKYAINVTDAQIAAPGPYNDFEHDGLPPGPIANPGNAAIEGILHPTPGDWLYFLTVTGGKSEFSATPLTGQ